MTSPPTYTPTTASERVTRFYFARRMRDLRANPPELFVDAIGPSSWFLNDRDYFGFERFPELTTFVNTKYVHVVDFAGQRFYLRRDRAVMRDALFNAHLPPKICAPNALRCRDTPVTVCTDLPAIQMPAHSRLDVECFPLFSELGPATILNNEAQPHSNRGFRLQHAEGDRYVVLLSASDHWAVSKEFFLAQRKAAFVSIELDGAAAKIWATGSQSTCFSLVMGSQIHLAQSC